MEWERTEKTDPLELICRIFQASAEEITGVEDWTKGMTNRLTAFCCRGKRYLIRLPGEGSNKLVDRRQEAEVYKAIGGKGISDRVIYIDPEKGCKITEFVENGHTCDPRNKEDVKRCISHLKKFHQMHLAVGHAFDPFEKMEYYESLWEGESSFPDYRQVKEDVLSLKPLIESCPGEFCLSHIDPNCDNFLLTSDRVVLIDWEYAGMCDPHVDIAMFAIYSDYTDQEIDWLLDLYFEGSCPEKARLKVYCYVAVCGLLWAGWCDYKKQMGVSYGEYAQKQYAYAKRYYRRAMELAQRAKQEGQR